MNLPKIFARRRELPALDIPIEAPDPVVTLPLAPPALRPATCGRAPGRRDVRVRVENSRMAVVHAIYPPGTTEAYLRSWAYRFAAALHEQSSPQDRWHIQPDFFPYEADHPQAGVSISCAREQDVVRAKELLSRTLRGEV